MLKLKKYGVTSYSQSGEDLVIDFVLKNHLKVDNPNYLDIGANDPVKYSNTYYFYKKGCSGVLVEPDPVLAEQSKKARNRDIVLDIGVSAKEEELDFYLMDPNTLNTFSENEVKQYKVFYNAKVREVLKVKTKTVNSILMDFFQDGLDILSIDVEGLDFEIISNLDFKVHRPKVVCIESMIYGNNKTLSKSNKIANTLFKKDYFLYADTFVNTIFVDKVLWKNLKQPDLKNMEGF